MPHRLIGRFRSWLFWRAPWVSRRRLDDALRRIDAATAEIIRLELAGEKLIEEADHNAREVLRLRERLGAGQPAQAN